MDAKCSEGIVISPFIKLNSSRLNDKTKQMYLRRRRDELPLESGCGVLLPIARDIQLVLNKYQKKRKKERSRTVALNLPNVATH